MFGPGRSVQMVYTNPCVYAEPAPGVFITVYYVSLSTMNTRFISLELLLTCLDLGARSRSSRRTGVRSITQWGAAQQLKTKARHALPPRGTRGTIIENN